MGSISVSSILKEGMIVSTKLGTGCAWYNNIVYKVTDNSVYISLLDDYIRNLVMPGSTFTVKHTNEFFEYIFEGVVSHIEVDNPAHMVINVNKTEELINTRVFPRFDINLPAYLKPVWTDLRHFAITTNICLGGMAFVSRHSFDYGEECEINVHLSDSSIVYAKGKIIRKVAKNNHIDYSMQFIEMDEDNNNLLFTHLLRVEDKNSSLQTNYFNNIKKHFKGPDSSQKAIV